MLLQTPAVMWPMSYTCLLWVGKIKKMCAVKLVYILELWLEGFWFLLMTGCIWTNRYQHMHAWLCLSQPFLRSRQATNMQKKLKKTSKLSNETEIWTAKS